MVKSMRNSVIVFFLLVFFTLSSCSKESESNSTGGINGIVTDKVSGNPISGANLTLSPGGLSKTSGYDGRYEFQNIDAQQYSVQASASGYTYNVRLITVTDGQSVKCDIHLMPN